MKLGLVAGLAVMLSQRMGAGSSRARVRVRVAVVAVVAVAVVGAFAGVAFRRPATSSWP